MKARVVWLILCVIWGSTWLFIKLGLADLPPLTFAGIRFVLASLILVAMILALPASPPVAPPSRAWARRLARRGAWWWVPLVLSVLFTVSVAVWLHYSDAADLEARQRQLISDSLSLESQIADRVYAIERHASLADRARTHHGCFAPHGV